MSEEITNNADIKKTWSVPKLIILNVSKTEGGPAESMTEDFQSGTINTNPS